MTEIIETIQERTDAAQLAKNNKFLNTTVAGFETPIIGSVRTTIHTLLNESQNTQKTPKPEMPLAITPKPPQNTESIVQPVSPPVLPLPTPRHIKTAHHQTEPKKHL